MIYKTPYSISHELLSQSIAAIPFTANKITLNYPTGEFFYDRWEIKDEYRGTIWDTVLNHLPSNKGEARLIRLIPGTCYMSHADIDDRWHLSLVGNRSYLIDLDEDKMHKLDNDGCWYTMDAGCIHSAVNFGDIDRVQLVVRQLLPVKMLQNPVNVKIESNNDRHDYRYMFDELVSPWLNRRSKQGFIHNFKCIDGVVYCTMNSASADELCGIMPYDFRITVSSI